MSTTTTQINTLSKGFTPARISLVSDATKNDPKWMTELRTKGWTVVPNALSKEKASSYADEGYKWLESWELGYDHKDESTRKTANLPWHIRGGLYAQYGIAHEQFMWDLRSEPSIVQVFEQIWGTHELLVSYDGANLSIPEVARAKTDPVFAPWSHVDQCPVRTNLQCVQGILNLLPNGPDDGGLMVLDGSSRLYTELWEHFDHKKGPNGWNTWEFQFLDEEMCEWLVSQGCKWVKVCAQPGDLLLWDSRTVHYGAAPSSTQDRFAAYVCYKPAAYVGEEARKSRADLFEKKQGTTHDPSIVRATTRLPPEDHPSYAKAVARPLQSPVLSERAKKLAGVEPY